MELADRVVVVTGGASGIGAALCRRFAAEGARGVVVADRDADGAGRVASEVDGLAVRCDVSVGEDVEALVGRARERFGPLDLFCSNAGIARGAGFGEDDPLAPWSDPAAWQRSFEVNVMAHVHAARAVLPEMLARGSGALLHTASAAGLLTDLGTAAYSVTKHAVVGLAEWLAVTYGDRGIHVACLCPQGVRTPMLGGALAGGVGGHLVPGMIEPEEVAEAVVEGLRAERFLILPHPEVREYVQRKADDPDRWLRGMRRLRARILAAR